MVIRHLSLTLPSVCYMVYKNVSSAASQYYPSPQITVYLDKALDDNAAARVVGQLQAEQGVEKVNYFPAMRRWVNSVTGPALAARWICLKRTAARGRIVVTRNSISGHRFAEYPARPHYAH